MEGKIRGKEGEDSGGNFPGNLRSRDDSIETTPASWYWATLPKGERSISVNGITEEEGLGNIEKKGGRSTAKSVSSS